MSTKEYGCAVWSCVITICIIIDLLVFWGCQELWNWLAPLFWKAAPILTYWQAAGCVILLEIIGSFFKSTNTKVNN